MRFTIRAVATIASALCVAAGSASAASIGVFFAPDASDCDGTVPVSTSGTIYIIALPGPELARGIDTAAFRLDGFPADWSATVTPNPAASAYIGSPLSGGCGIGFPTCQVGPRVLLYTIDFFATSAVGETYLRIDRHPDAPPWFPCPRLTDTCDGGDSIICANGGQAILNGRACTTDIEPRSWTQVKQIYD